MDTPRENAPVAPVTPEHTLTHETPTLLTAPHTERGSESPWHKNTSMIRALVIAAILLGGAFFYTQSESRPSNAAAVLCPKEHTLFKFCYKGKHTITKAALDENIALINEVAVGQGADVSDPTISAQIREQAFAYLVDNALILMAATGAGIHASDEEVQTKYDELIAQVGGQEAFAAELAQAGITEEKLRSNIRERVLADKYLETKTEPGILEVSDAELLDAYNTIKEATPDIPTLDEVKPMLSLQIESKKRQQRMEELLTEAREATRIVVSE